MKPLERKFLEHAAGVLGVDPRPILDRSEDVLEAGELGLIVLGDGNRERLPDSLFFVAPAVMDPYTRVYYSLMRWGPRWQTYADSVTTRIPEWKECLLNLREDPDINLSFRALSQLTAILAFEG